jgi:virginiamycin B lyase
LARVRWVGGALTGTALALVPVVALGGCTGMAEPNPAIKRGPAPAPTTTIPAAAFATSDPLLARLRSGGYVLVLRHAQTVPASGPASADPADCGGQPSLSAAGRAQARTLGTALGRLAVPVATVLASPWCATRDTAFLAFGRVQGAGDLDQPRSAGQRQRLGRRVRSLASTPPPAGTNTVLVTHGATVAAAFGITPAEGETLVIRPGSGNPWVVRRVAANGWMALAGSGGPTTARSLKVSTYRLDGRQPADVAPAPVGPVWWAAPASGQVGRFDPGGGRVRQVRLGAGASPQAVVLGPDGAPWVADAGRNALLRVDPRSLAVRTWSLPAGRPDVGLASLTFDRRGTLWFTGRRGVIGRLEPGSGSIEVFDAPAGSGPDAITTTARGEVFYVAASAGNLARVDLETGAAEVLHPPTPGPLGRAATDAGGRVWVAQPGSGQVAVYDPASGGWREWRLPGANGAAQPEGIWVDPTGTVWLSDAKSSALTSFDPRTERFQLVTLPVRRPVGRLAGRSGEVWAAAPGAGRLVVARG